MILQNHVGARRTPPQNNYKSRADHQPTGVLFEDHLFPVPGRFFEQLQGKAMGSPISPIVANLYMEDFKIKVINTAEYSPRIWKRYVDDTFVVIDSVLKKKFLEGINNMDPHIQFTTEDAEPDGSIPFLDTIVMPQPDNSLLTSVYRKPTHTDLYLHLSAKFSVINTLKHRAKTVCSNHQLLKEEEDHLNKALRWCSYPAWALNRATIKQKNNNRTNHISGNKRTVQAVITSFI